MPCFLDHGLQLLAGMEGDDAPGADRNFLSGLGIAAGALRLVAQLEIAEAGELDALAPLQGAADLLEEGLDHVLGLALVQPDLLEQQIGEFRLGQRHPGSLPFYLRRLAENFRPSRLTSVSRAASASASVRVLSVSCITTRNARLFLPAGRPAPRYTLKSLTERRIAGFSASMASKTA